MTQDTERKYNGLRVVPLLAVVALSWAIPVAAAYLAEFTSQLLRLGITPDRLLPWLYLHHAWQLLLALVAIAVAKYFVPADYGLHLPRGKSYVGPALIFGVFCGLLMLAMGDWNLFLTHGKPDMGYPLTPANVAGWLFFEGVYVGPTEEIPFRALLVSYLAATMPGSILRIGRFSMNWAGVICAALFALAHAGSFFTGPWESALAQQIYAFLFGVGYAWLLEKSRSVLAPAIAHNVGDFLITAMESAWQAFG
jgi:uncharacterized protein